VNEDVLPHLDCRGVLPYRFELHSSADIPKVVVDAGLKSCKVLCGQRLVHPSHAVTRIHHLNANKMWEVD
jgi:hypothetical protein